jgi:hypothetical protein
MFGHSTPRRGHVVAVVLLVFSHGGCFMSPVGQYQVPESIGKGNLRGGLAVGGAVRTEHDLGLSERALGVTSDAWIEYGVGERSDLRFRLSNLMILDLRPEREFLTFDVLAFDCQFKRSSTSGSSAFVAGVQPYLVFDVVGDETDVGSGAPSVYIGWVFGFGDRGSMRFLLTPTIAVGTFGLFDEDVFWVQLAASSGLEIPVSGAFFLRPELTVHFAPVFAGDGVEAVAMATVGMALAF